MTALPLIGRALVATALTAGAVLTPAAASAVPVASTLQLSVTGQPGTSGFRTALLTCEPHGGTHPNAQKACADLIENNGDLHAMAKQEPRPMMCTLDLKEVTVRATGTWRGKQVDFEQKFPNICVAKSHTGEVFAF
ncbi:SSI family serine proteinase inhibitor [Saccharopolyspora taberi]|uniref:SSI family serine proteinase inhibitor n=1 Tax=Saccharopolyspora taberi TaxID=60895 RepID=A0ABN3VBX7_9PSEU